MAFQPAFVWGQGGQRMTPEEIARQRQIVDALMGQTDTSPVAHWTQGAARLVDALGTRLDENRLNNAEEQNTETNRDLMSALMGGIGGGSASPVASSPSVASALTAGPTETPAGQAINSRVASAHGDDLTAYQDAIASIESAGSGDYAAIGPTHPELGRALGRYQVMEANIGPWSEAALGYAVSPDEFMASPEIQDAVFNHQFGGYVDDYGLEGAAQAWFGGPGGVGQTGRSDSLGTTIGEYGQKFNAALGGSQQPQGGVQVTQSGGISPAIIEAMTSPYADESTRQMASILLEQQLQQNDPGRQLEMEIQREKLNQLRNPRPETTAEMQNLQWRAQQAGLQPGTQEYTDFMLSGGRGPETVVNNNMGGNKFAEEFAKSDATALAEISQTGLAAQRNVARIDRLDQLLSTVPTGAEANFKQIAANYGLSLGEDVDNIQAAQALINSLVPEQRPAGSGPMSDADLELFKQSLPRIVNQPGGNQIIINTMRAIAQYDAQGAEIVQRLRQGEIDRSAAFEALQSRENPLAVLRDIDKGEDQPAQLETLEIDGNTVPEGVDPEDWKYMSEEDRALFR